MTYNLLKGKKGIIFGALNEQSIAWKVAERAVEEGAEIVLTNTAMSIRLGSIVIFRYQNKKFHQTQVFPELFLVFPDYPESERS